MPHPVAVAAAGRVPDRSGRTDVRTRAAAAATRPEQDRDDEGERGRGHGDREGRGVAAEVGKRVLKGEVQYFPAEQMDAAKAWLAES